MLLCLVDLDQEELLHLLQLRCLLPRPLSLLGVDLRPPQPVLVIHRKTIMETILSIEMHFPRLYNFGPIDHDRNGQS